MSTTLNHINLRSNSFDLGIFENINFQLSHFKSTYNTFEKANHFSQVHFSPILYLFVPFYWIFKSPIILLISQSVLLGIPSVFIYLIGKKITNNQLISSCIAISYLLSPALHGVNTFDFHEVAFLPLLILGSLYFLLERKIYPYFIFIILTCLVKEDSSLSVFMIGVYALVNLREIKIALITCLFSLLYFLIVTKVILSATMISRFSDFLGSSTNGIQGIILTIITNPTYVIKFIINYDLRISYWFLLLSPVLYLPFLSRIAVLIILPASFISLFSNYFGQNSIDYHYSACILPFIYFLTIHGINNMKQYATYICMLLIFSGFMFNNLYGKLPFNPKTIANRDFVGSRSKPIISMLKNIPPSSSVSASNNLCPHLSARDSIYLFPQISNADYIVFDFKSPIWPLESLEKGIEIIQNEIDMKRYGVVDMVDGCVLLKKGATNNREISVLEMKFRPNQLSCKGEVIIDTAATNQTSLKIDLKNTLNTYPVYGPFIKLESGQYKIRFRLKSNIINTQDELVALDIYPLKNPIYKIVRGNSFIRSDSYQNFDLYLDLKESTENLEFRVYSKGNGYIWFDSIELWKYKLN